MLNEKAQIQAVRPFDAKTLAKQPDLEFTTWLRTSPGPYSLEIGAGVGWHSIQWAQSHPQENLISLERTKTKFAKFKQRQSRHNLNNLFLSNNDALDWLPANLTTITLRRVFFLYPNPYPKERQANKRWHRSSLFHFILDRLSLGGTIHLATNEEFYASEAQLYFTQFWNLDIERQEVLTQATFSEPRTHFEKKYLNRGHNLYDFVFRKVK